MTLKGSIFFTLLIFLGGCANFGYYLDSMRGQMDMLRRAQPIEAVISNRHTLPPLKSKLAAVLGIREFASRELHLPDNGSYRNYADLERPYVVWNVFAAPEFSIEPKEWCFAVAGCVNYRGYFAKADAKEMTTGLQQQAYDVFISGVPAYSTLGWFDDPVLNTFIHYPETTIAQLIFHELAHQVVYVRDDSVFNESFATAVETEGMRRWLERKGTAEQRVAFQLAQQRNSQFIALMLDYRGKLRVLYGSALSVDQKRAAKRHIFHELQKQYQQLKSAWGDYGGYDNWFSQEPNNAQLASIAIYTQLVPAFQALLAQQQGDLARFYQAVRDIAKLPESERSVVLQRFNGIHIVG